MPRKARLKINAYNAVSDAAERAVRHGWHRAHKHTENPTEDQMCEAMYDAFMNELCEVIDFD